MQLGDWETTKDLNPIYADLRRLDLECNIAELDAFGFTVIPPEKVAPPEFHRELLQAVLDVHERRTGHRIDPDAIRSGTLEGDRQIAIHVGLLGEERAFETALLNPAVYTMARYLCGGSVVLSDMNGLIKRRDERPTHRLHVDQSSTPSTLLQSGQFVNITWTLTDYTLENGPLGVVPGSHRFGRAPTSYEEDSLRPDAPVKAIPVECETGSLVIFGGSTWHTAFPRTAPGLRVTLAITLCRPFMKTQWDFTGMPQEVLDRNPPEFAKLIGVNALFPMNRHMGDAPMEVFEAHRAAGRSLWG